MKNKSSIIISKNLVFDDVGMVLLLSKTTCFYDVVVMSGDINVIRRIKKLVSSDSLIIKDSIYEKMALLVLDTCVSFSDGKKLFNFYEKKIRRVNK